MSKKDFFADIAFTQHPYSKDSLMEVKPLIFDKQYFKPSHMSAVKRTVLTYEDNISIFKDELNKLKSYYRPFMGNYSPDQLQKREKLELKNFQFRYKAEDDNQIQNLMEGRGEWEEVTIPDYRGPAGEDGKWTGYYRTVFNYSHSKSSGKRVFIVFKGVDYIANVFLNGQWVGSHEGFFAPFEFDVTDILKEQNILVVEVKNDYPTVGADGGSILDGDKIYAATGLGWDDPADGWHHCPPGAGIYNRVYLEEREELFIDDIFVRPDIDRGIIEVWVDITNTANLLVKDFDVFVSVYPRNFEGKGITDLNFKVEYAGPGINYYRYKIDLRKTDILEFRLWEPETPWLYTARCSISMNERVLDQKDRTFGMRKFHMDEDNLPRGTLYLNNKPIILRGANEMGHLQQCVVKDDYEQLIEDILIAKLANMNYYRITQRPVQEEIYDYFDMLGMMHQCDLPLFGHLRRNKFCEAVKQAGEMERLIRSHPSSIMVTFINEPFPIGINERKDGKSAGHYHEKGHRHLFRDELEAFFEAARKAIYIENPDRVIKNVEGDYDPPTRTGLSDFHCYNMWYTNHALPIGKLYKGYLPPIKKGWKTGCGEFGTEGLDNYDVMMKYYPKEWLPDNDQQYWIPDKIVKSQTNSMHGDWFEEQDNIKDWIEKSQNHQAFATKIMCDALRKRSDLVVSTAIHLLIDAWPSGWMKTLVGVDRIPKKAYFEFKKSMEPLRINLRCDRWKAYEEEVVDVEAWILNDRWDNFENLKIVATLRDEYTEYQSFEIVCKAKPVSASIAGIIPLRLPKVKGRKKIYLDADLLKEDGKCLNSETFCIEVFEKTNCSCHKKIVCLGDKAEKLVKSLNKGNIEDAGEEIDSTEGIRIVGIDSNMESGIESVAESAAKSTMKSAVKSAVETAVGTAIETADVIVISSSEKYEENKETITKKVYDGAKVVFIRDDDQNLLNWEIDNINMMHRGTHGKFFAVSNKEDGRTKSFREGDFSYLYNKDRDLIDFTIDNYIECNGIKPQIYTYAKPEFFGSVDGRKKKLTVVGSMILGKGEIIAVGMLLDGRIGCNPTLDMLLHNLINT